MMTPRLAIIDDDPEIAEVVATVSESRGFEIFAFTSPNEFIWAYERIKPDVIVMDIVMPEIDGIEVIQSLVKLKSDAAIILISGYSGRYIDAASAIGEIGGLNILGTLEKPFGIADLEKILARYTATV